MSVYTGQFGKPLAMLGQFQFGGVVGVGLAGVLGSVTARERWAAPAYAVCWTDIYKGTRWSLSPRRMTNV